MIVVLLMVMALTSTDWLMAEGWREGLFSHCISSPEEGSSQSFTEMEQKAGCYGSRDEGKYILFVLYIN